MGIIGKRFVSDFSFKVSMFLRKGLLSVLRGRLRAG